MILTGQKLADTYAQVYARELESITGKPTQGKVWAHDLGGGWIELRGESLPAHPKLQKQYPNGWGLLAKKRYGYVRKYIEGRKA